MTDAVKIYHNPRCSKSRDTLSLLKSNGVDPEVVMYLETPPDAAALMALPQHAATGAKLVWESADMIWTALGDSSRDYNWYSKRLTLSGVISGTVLYWMNDESEGRAASWEFLDRRIAEVMQIEKIKGRVTGLPGLKSLLGCLQGGHQQQLRHRRDHRAHLSENDILRLVADLLVVEPQQTDRRILHDATFGRDGGGHGGGNGHADVFGREGALQIDRHDKRF